MKFECVKERFEHALQMLERIAVKNATLPILACVSLEAKNGTVTLKTTNLELGVETTIPVKVIEKGEVAVPISNLLSFVTAIRSDKNITLEMVGTTVKVIIGKSEALFHVMNHAEFPLIPKIHNEQVFTVAVSDFVEGIKSVCFAAAINTVKPEYAAVMVNIDNESFTFVATDSFRLAEKKISLKKGLKKEVPYILIPNKNAQEIARILGFISEKEVSVTLEGQQISFITPSLYITSRLIEGTFPDYKQIIPQGSETEVVVAKQDIVNTLKAATVFSDTFSQIHFHIEPKKELFEIETKNQVIGEQKTNLPAAFKGEGISMNFNHRYITDCIPSLITDTLSFSFNGVGKPLIIRGVGDKTFMYLLMPMNR